MTLPLILLTFAVSIIAVLSFLILILYTQNKVIESLMVKRIFYARNIYHLEILIDEYPLEKLEIKSHKDDLKNITNELRKEGLYKYFVSDLINIEKLIEAKENKYKIKLSRKQLQFN